MLELRGQSSPGMAVTQRELIQNNQGWGQLQRCTLYDVIK